MFDQARQINSGSAAMCMGFAGRWCVFTERSMLGAEAWIDWRPLLDGLRPLSGRCRGLRGIGAICSEVGCKPTYCQTCSAECFEPL